MASEIQRIDSINAGMERSGQFTTRDCTADCALIDARDLGRLASRERPTVRGAGHMSVHCLVRPQFAHGPEASAFTASYAGAFQGAIGDVPVYNVAVPVLGADFFVFELDGSTVRPA